MSLVLACRIVQLIDKLFHAKNDSAVNWPFAGKKFLATLHSGGGHVPGPSLGMEDDHFHGQGHASAGPMMNQQFPMGPGGPYPPYRMQQPQASFVCDLEQAPMVYILTSRYVVCFAGWLPYAWKPRSAGNGQWALWTLWSCCCKLFRATWRSRDGR